MKKILLCITALGLCVSWVQAKTITACIDENIFYPFSFEEDKKAKGMWVDIAEKAGADLGHKVEVTPIPWKRCLQDVEKGNIDAVIAASYKDERAEFMHYPEDAKTAKKSDWRLTQVEYVVVTNIGDTYKYEGDNKTIPAPVRAPKGWSIVDDLTKQGIEVDAAKGLVNNVKKLMRDNKGAVVSISTNIDVLNKDPEYAGKLKVHETPISSKSYYMTISKKSKLSDKERQQLWDAIIKVRADDKFMAKVTAKY